MTKGLKNRFPQWVFEWWNGINWHTDFIDGRNDADALNHTISPLSDCYVPGKHNESILNSSPLNNFRNHIGQPMHGGEKESMFLNKTLKVLVLNGYEFRKIDSEFYKIYSRMYG